MLCVIFIPAVNNKRDSKAKNGSNGESMFL